MQSNNNDSNRGNNRIPPGDEGQLERMECTHLWQFSWARIVGLIWSIIPSEDEYDEKCSPLFSSYEALLNGTAKFLSEKVGDDTQILEFLREVGDESNPVFPQLESIVATAKEKGLTVFQATLHFFGYVNAHQMNMTLDWSEDQWELRNSGENADGDTIYHNGWMDPKAADGNDVYPSLRFDITLKIPRPPRRRFQPTALMDYEATGVSIPFTT